MGNRHRHKACRVLSLEEAQQRLSCALFYRDVYELVKCFTEFRFMVECLKSEEFKYRLKMEYPRVFDELYHGAREELIRSYLDFYQGSKHHNEGSFMSSVSCALADKLDYAFSDGKPTDGFGAIY